MFVRVETQWPCWVSDRTVAPGKCEGTMVVLGEDNFHSLNCSKCGLGTAGRGPLPDTVVGRLIEEGYVRQLGKRPVDGNDLFRFLQERKNRSLQELAGDTLERFEVFWK